VPVQHERLARAERFSGHGAVERDGHFLADQPLSLREIQRQDAHLIRQGLKYGEARIFMMNHAAQRSGNGV